MVMSVEYPYLYNLKNVMSPGRQHSLEFSNSTDNIPRPWNCLALERFSLQ